MQIDIAALNFELTPALRRHALRQVRAGVRGFGERISGAMIRLRDENGPRGGVDMGCRIVLWLNGGGTIIVDALEADLYAAVDAATLKLREAVRRRLKRRRTLRREYANRRARQPAA